MTKTWGSTLWLVSSLVLLSACGGSVEAEAPGAGAPGATAASDITDIIEAEVGRGHGCPRQASQCRTYCRQKGHTSGGCYGYGGGNCECRDTEPAPLPAP